MFHGTTETHLSEFKAALKELNEKIEHIQKWFNDAKCDGIYHLILEAESLKGKGYAHMAHLDQEAKYHNPSVREFMEVAVKLDRLVANFGHHCVREGWTWETTE